MKVLVVGLGNPQMNLTRHNVGADVLKLLIQDHTRQIEPNLYSLNEYVLFLVHPESMNTSGNTVKKVFDYNGCTHLIVLVDELDMNFGKVKKVFSNGARGHNGMRSVLSHFPEDIWQILIGIGRPSADINVGDYVLGKFTHNEQQKLPEIAYNVGEMVFEIIANIKNTLEI